MFVIIDGASVYLFNTSPVGLYQCELEAIKKEAFMLRISKDGGRVLPLGVVTTGAG